jgi:NTP pyrophosphatase (non-canonical NTP hydrolase)
VIQTYQKFVASTSGAYKELTKDDGRIAAAALGLVGEAGEASEVIKKGLFHGHGIKTEELHKELGDVLWYVAELCNASGTTLEAVIQGNMEKLKRRYPNGFSAERSIAREDERR